MWKCILIAALCLFQKSYPSPTPGYEYESATEKSEIGADGKESTAAMLPEELDYSLRNNQENSVELNESVNAASHENKDLSELALSNETTKDSSKGSEKNENVDSIANTEALKLHFSENVTDNSSPSTEMAREATTVYVLLPETTISLQVIEEYESIPTDVTAHHVLLPDTTIASKVIEESESIPTDVTAHHVLLPDTTIGLKMIGGSESIPIDTINGINPDGNLTEETNSSFPTVSSTTQKESFSLKSLFNDEKEKSLPLPTVTPYESPRIYDKENPENITEEPFENTSQDNSTYQPTNISEGIPPAEKPTFVSPTNYDKLTTTSLFIFDEFPLHTQIKDVAKTTPNTHENSGEESDVSVELTSTPNITEATTSVSIPEETEIPPTKQMLNQTYKLILKGNCSEDAFMSPIFQSLNLIFNNQLNAKNSTKLMKCEYVYELNFTSNIASPESFNEVIILIKEKISPNMEVSIVNYDSTTYQISHTTPSDSESFVVPKSMVYISSAATIAMLLFMIFIIICVRNKCRRHSTSLDLSDIPHLTLSVDDYKLAPIPRPSVSFPESNRDFLHAYSNETYNRTKEDDTVLTQHHFSSNVGKTYDAASGQKDSALNQEMHTFTARRCASRNRNDLKSASAHEYSTPDSWDRLKGRENGKKHGLDNPAFRRW